MSEHIVSIKSGKTMVLHTAGKYCDKNIVVTAEGGSCEPTPTTYRASSIDELPTDALDGSMAIVENGSIVGTWYFNETLTPLNKPFTEGYEDIFIRCLATELDREFAFNVLCFCGDSTHLEEIEFSWYVTPGNPEMQVTATSLYAGGWNTEDARTIEILEDTDDTVFKDWVKQNATRKSGGYSLYIRENGEWVYEREIDDGYDEGYSEGFTAGDSNGYNQGLTDGAQDAYDAFWGAYQENGNRKDYAYAFAGIGWNDNSFKPKYDIVPTKADNIFTASGIADLPKLLTDAGVSLDMSQCKDMTYLALSNNYLQIVPTISLVSMGSIDYFLYNCWKLHTVEKVILKTDGSQAFTTYAFKGLPQLKEIRFEGCIGKNLEIKDSPLLSVASVQSIIDHLKDLTGQTSQTLTLHETVGANLTDEQIVSIGERNWTLVYGGQTISVFYVQGSRTFSFAVKGGLTWEEFVNSAYNMDGFFEIVGSTVYFNDPAYGQFQIYGGSTGVPTATDTIDLNTTYGA